MNTRKLDDMVAEVAAYLETTREVVWTLSAATFMLTLARARTGAPRCAS
jgi:hypothetical protein